MHVCKWRCLCVCVWVKCQRKTIVRYIGKWNNSKVYKNDAKSKNTKHAFNTACKASTNLKFLWL